MSTHIKNVLGRITDVGHMSRNEVPMREVSNSVSGSGQSRNLTKARTEGTSQWMMVRKRAGDQANVGFLGPRFEGERRPDLGHDPALR